MVVRSPGNPDYRWENFLLLAAWPGRGAGDRWLARFAAEFPLAHRIALGVDSAPDEDGTDEDDTDEDDTDEDGRPVPAEFLAAGWSRSATPCSPAPPSGRRRIPTPTPRSGGWSPTPTGGNRSG